ncbi:MAG TPA: T9SS type A sorting domain-containing protein [Mycobacterium sp.]
MNAHSSSEISVRCRARQLAAISLFGICSLVFQVCLAQPLAKQSDLGAYAIPYASESNRIELEVVNSTESALEDVTVMLDVTPAWLAFETASETIGQLPPGKVRAAIFTFDIDEKAPVGEVAELEFEVVAGAGEGVPPSPASPARRDDGRVETRTILIQAEAPTELTLRGNYPNPFNPTTKITYALPQDGNVEIEIFNAIGQRVARIVDQVQKAGYQEALWNAAGVPSGVYFYAVTLDVERARQVKFGRMVVLK